MPTTMLKYYFLKDIIKELPDGIKDINSIDENILFDSASLLDVGSFYLMFNPFKKDKYKLNEKLNSDLFNQFLYECILNFKKKPDENKLILIYALVTSYTLNKYINPFILAHTNKHLNFFNASNMIDFYYSKLRGIDLSKIDLTYKFLKGFKYYDFTNEIIDKPINKTFNFLVSKNYFKKAYKDEWIYYSYFTRSRFKIRLFFFKIYDLILNHKKGKNKLSKSLIKNKIDTSLLNITKKKYIINDKEYFNSLDELIKQAHNEAFGILTMINNNLFYNIEMEFNNYFDVKTKKEIKKLEEEIKGL